MTSKKRVETIRILIGQHPALSASTKLAALYGELNRILDSERSKRDSSWLLSVLHTTRALDTTLSELLAAKNWTCAQPNLNEYLKVLTKQNVLSDKERGAFSKEIVHKRNKYMHEAGAFPAKPEADGILREMEACLTIVVSRVV